MAYRRRRRMVRRGRMSFRRKVRIIRRGMAGRRRRRPPRIGYRF